MSMSSKMFNILKTNNVLWQRCNTQLMKQKIKPTTITTCQKRFISTRQLPFTRIMRAEQPTASTSNFSTGPVNDAMTKLKAQAKLTFKIIGYTAVSVTTAVALVWQLSHWYIEHFLASTPAELGYQARNLLHGAYIRENVVPDYEVASFYVRQALNIALEEKKLDEHSDTVIELRLRLAHDEMFTGNLLDAITEYTRAWKILMEKNSKDTRLVGVAKALGGLYLRINDLNRAEEFLAWSLHNVQKEEAVEERAKVTLTLASLYAMQRQFDLALGLLSETLKMLHEDNHEQACLRAIVQNQLAETMYGLGKVEESMGWAQAALESSAINTKNQDCLECGGVAANNLGRMLETMGKFDQALEYYNQAVAYSESVHDSASHDRYVLNMERVQDILDAKIAEAIKEEENK